jgi:nitroreductase
MIDCARVAPYGANLQPLKFKIVTDEGVRRKMFEHIKYAGYIPEWNPTFEESPTAFIVVVNDTEIKPTDKLYETLRFLQEM